MSDQAKEMLHTVGARAPRAIQRLESAATRLSTAASPGDFQAIALLCRDVLIDYADSVFSPDFVPDGIPQPAYDHFVNKIDITLRYFDDRGGSDKARKLLHALAEHVQSRQHDPTTEADEAAAVVHFTIAILVEIERLLNVATNADKLVQKFGTYRCPICRSRSLEEDAVVDQEWADGQAHAYLVGWELYCTECGWRKGP